jgi:hypothetical protein
MMRKTLTHFEQVPVAVAEKILEREMLLAKRNGDRQLADKKVERIASGLHTVSEKVEDLAP